MAPREVRIGGKTFKLPAQKRWRIALGIALMLGGVLGFLPVLGFWMIPLGFVIISYDIAMARRARRKTVVWWKRRNGNNRNGLKKESNADSDLGVINRPDRGQE